MPAAFLRRLTPASLGLALVLISTGIPLAYGLGRSEMGSDEAIYSYAVERMLETGDWLTPRGIPSDAAFYEKPPLKFWLVAGAMKAGLVPVGDAGMRVFDALFGIAAFAYVYLLGVRLGGPVSGGSAALILFAFSPLVFDHGLRSNNMEAALVLAYAGGIFHFVRWVEAVDVGRRRREALIVALFFVLGFMTKFVAALFLPLVCAAALLARPRPTAIVRERWRDWIAPLVLVCALVLPWFVYQTTGPDGGRLFWHVIVGEHVYRRLAGVLIPEHLQPWHHYFTATWREFRYAHALLAVLAGLVVLVHAAWRRGEWLPRVLLLWFALPFAVMSLGTSKLLHYAYPFIAPLALGGGLACALGLRALMGGPGARVSAAVRERVPALVAWARKPAAQRVLLVAGVVLLALGAVTAIAGPLEIERQGVRLFRSGSVARPVVLGVVCLGLTSWGRRRGIGFGLAVLLLVLPIDRYVENVRRVGSVYHPLRAIRDCTLVVARTSPGVGRGMLRATGDVLHHSYFYYMRHAGPWLVADPPANRDAILRSLGPGETRPVFVTRAIEAALPRHVPVRGVLVEENVAVLLPGPFESCIPGALAAGARPLGAPASGDTPAP